MIRSLILSALLTCLAMGCGSGTSPSTEALESTTRGNSSEDQTNVAFKRVFTNLAFDEPVALIQRQSNQSIWYIVEQSGRVLSFVNEQTASAVDVFLDIRDRVLFEGELGLLGLAFSPDSDIDGVVYVSYTGQGPISYLSRFRLDESGAVDEESEEVLLQVNQDFLNHNGGHIVFGPDRLLYLGLGDGGSANDPNNRAQDTANLLGSLVRIEVSSESGYEVPPTNPFFGEEKCSLGFGSEPCPEIFAFGLRNPWRFSFDRLTNELWLADVGQSDFEEINKIEIGRNYGWRLREGAHCNANITDAGCEDGRFTDPVSEYTHAFGQSITGGFVYRGFDLPLEGRYIGGDFVSGVVFSFNESTGELATILETGMNISSFAEDSDGELYFLDYTQGHILKLVIDAEG